ncbi:MAG: rod shape-determining protein RodA [Planctomycetes bacterium]|nr:rod shape-determining protein RodA [Planctomycetota bacterium]
MAERPTGRLPLTLVLLVLALLLLGLAAISDATADDGATPFWRSFLGKQVIFAVLGWSAFGLALSFHYYALRDLAYAGYAVGILGLIAVLAKGGVQLGARRWIPLGFFNLQPSEPMKLCLVLALARLLSRSERLDRPSGLLLPLGMTALPMGFVVLQPDLGTSLVLLPILLAMLFVAGARPLHLAAFLLALVAVVGVAFSPLGQNLLHDYQRKRILAFLNPEAMDLEEGYQLIRARIAIGSGGVWGKWWDEAAESNFRTVPIRQNDFIFTVVAEQYGFLGASALIGLYLALLVTCLRLASHTRDPYGRLLIVGITSSIAVQFLVNVAMTLQLVPTTGITLPFVSYGGSSLLTSFASLGLIANVSMRRVPTFAARDYEHEPGEIRALGPRT